MLPQKQTKCLVQDINLLFLIPKGSLIKLILLVWNGILFQGNDVGESDLIQASGNFHVIITCRLALSHKLLL